MSAGLAHEIGNPLAALVGFVDYLRSAPNIDDDLRNELFKRIDGGDGFEKPFASSSMLVDRSRFVRRAFLSMT